MRRTLGTAYVFLLACALAACAEHPLASAPQPAKAIIEPDIVRAARTLEAAIDAQSNADPVPGQAWFKVLKGDRPILVTAPHATRPMRDGKYRFSDGGGTAALVEALHQTAQTSGIYTTQPSPSDPNYYDDNAFKAALLEQLQAGKPMLVLDIHGSAPERPYDVDLGTMNGESLQGQEAIVEKLQAALRVEGLINLSSNFFAASKNQTVTKFVAAHGGSAIQLEINSTWLNPAESDLGAHRFAQLLQALTRFVQDVSPSTNSGSTSP